MGGFPCHRGQWEASISRKRRSRPLLWKETANPSKRVGGPALPQVAFTFFRTRSCLRSACLLASPPSKSWLSGWLPWFGAVVAIAAPRIFRSHSTPLVTTLSRRSPRLSLTFFKSRHRRNGTVTTEIRVKPITSGNCFVSTGFARQQTRGSCR